VNVNGVCGRVFWQGLPRGSALSPLLFLVWHVDRNVAVCSERLQGACDIVVQWCEDWLIKLTAGKCSVMLFSINAKDADMSGLRVCLNGCNVARVRSPCFLEVTFDSRLIQVHVGRVVEKARVRLNALRKLAGSDWGLEKDLMKSPYVVLVVCLGSVVVYVRLGKGPTGRGEDCLCYAEEFAEAVFA